ncbi:MAG: glycosyltransferase family 39 protein [Bacteroidetes bacterium]|nr:glycosyltransferase family 39 protein [Bacteroidota bacterium]
MTDKLKIFAKNNVWLILIVTTLFFLNYYNKTLFQRPSIIHIWRQADCLSIAKNYYEEGMNFFQPKIHHQGVEGGKAVSEFPILNYTAAALWKIFGEHEFIYRLIEYALLLLSQFVLLNTLLRFFKSQLLALFTVSVFLTSPLLAYYGVSFIADVPAFSLGLISFCLFYTFYRDKQLSFFYLALFTGTLAVLMKASALMGLSFLLFFSVIDFLNLNARFKTEKLFQKKLLPVVFTSLAVLVVFAWYKYALYYNNNNNNGVFLLTVLPIWELDEGEIMYIGRQLFSGSFPVFLNRPMLFLIFAIAIYVSTNFKHLENFLRYAFVFSAGYFLAYLLFFFQVFSVHDYYLNNLMIFPAVTLFSFCSILYKREFIPANKTFFRSFLILSLLFNSLYCAAYYRMRTIKNDNMANWYPFITEEEKSLYDWVFWDYGISTQRIENFGSVLKSHGVKRDDFVLSIPDFSFDVSLYFLDQKGFTIGRQNFIEDTTVLNRFFNKNIKYVVMSDAVLQNEKAFINYKQHFEPFFTHNEVKVFKFKE